MSKIVARMEKMKDGNLSGIQRHNQRETNNHSNPDIDIEKSHLNYDLVNPGSINYREKIKQIIESQRISKRAVRKDAVLVNEWIITSDTAFFQENTDTIKETRARAEISRPKLTSFFYKQVRDIYKTGTKKSKKE